MAGVVGEEGTLFGGGADAAVEGGATHPPPLVNWYNVSARTHKGMLMRVLHCGSLVLLTLSIPWLLIALLTAFNLTDHSRVVAFLGGGGPRGYTISALLFAIPTVVAGMIVGFMLWPRLSQVVLVAFATVALAFANLQALQGATARWPIPLLESHDVMSAGRALQTTVFVLMGCFFGSVVRMNRAAEAAIKRR